VLEHGQSVHVPEEQVSAGGVKRTLTTWKVPLRDDRGRIEGLVGLAMDISGRKEMEEALRRSNEALTRANTELAQFAYAAAHDLREPLRTIALYTQILERRHLAELSDGGARVVGYILDSANRMETLVNDLLVYTQVVSHAAELGADSDGVAAETAEALRAALSESRGELRFQALPRVAVGRVHLRQLMQNLIANALQYRHPDRPPQIELTAEQIDSEVVFRIRDNGVGIRPEYHEQIFGLFKRLHGLDVPGNGIGLALCKKIVEHYGGRIWVESRYGEGSIFAFTLPVAPPPTG
jgi:light-regulated signal transduction histidine kinase (bacteriophytochrome)